MESEDFEYERDEAAYSGELRGSDEHFQGTAKSTVVQNQPHDEEVALSDTESFAGPDEPPAAPRDASLIESHDMDEMVGAGTSAAAAARAGSQQSGGGGSGAQYDLSTKSTSAAAALAAQSMSGAIAAAGAAGGASSSGGTAEGEGLVGTYNAQDYKHLNVSDEIRDLFQYIGRYKPQTIELEARLKPFIPDYIPAIGGIDEFIKVPRPDGKPDFLGLKVLDEPASRQSDPTVLTLQLRQLSKEAPGNKAEMVGRIEHTDDNKAKRIQQWIGSIADIHKSKPPPTVTYSRKMPDIETLMQEWPPEMENALKTMKLPSGDLDLDIKAYARMICALLDIPVYENPIESMHLLFTLYLEFKNNPLFKQHMEMENRLGVAGGGDSGGFASGGMGMGGGGFMETSAPGGANVLSLS